MRKALALVLLAACSHPRKIVVTPIWCSGARPGQYVIREVFVDGGVTGFRKLDDGCFVGERIAMDVAEAEDT